MWAAAQWPSTLQPLRCVIELYFSSSSSFSASEMIESWKMLLWNYFWLPSLHPWFLPAHWQPLAAVRRGFQWPGFSLKCCNTSFLRAQLHCRGERKMAGELHKIPFIWGVRFFSPFCRTTKPLTAVKVLPCWVPVEANSGDRICQPLRWPCHSQRHD